MEQLIAELKRCIAFKDTTETGDIVLVVSKKPQMLAYGVVTGIERDQSRRDEWWRVTIQFLTVPMQVVTWTLRQPQFSGREIFTMGGEPRFVKAVEIDFAGGSPHRAPASGDFRNKDARPGLHRIK